MLDIIWLVICVIVAVPLVINPSKVTERPGCKIKSAKMVRVAGIAIVIIGVLMMFI